MQTAQIVSLAFALAGYAMAAPLPYSAVSAATSAAAATGTASASSRPKIPGSNTLTYCQDPSTYLMTFSDTSVNPLAPKPGQNVTVHISGTLKRAITDGAKHKVVFGKIEDGQEKQLFTSTSDLCAGLDHVPEAVMKQFHGQKCPIEAGPFNITNSMPVPAPQKGLPPPPVPTGDFCVRGTTTLESGEEVACIMADLKAEGQLASN